ncbi:protein E17A [Elephant endotheliotropic herpesvirus 5B]|nr:protein E17A [Elephant endotheliotropic herpesvirus 5B]
MSFYFFLIWPRSTIKPSYIRARHLRNKLRKQLFYSLCLSILNGLCYALHALVIYHLKQNYMPWHVHRQYLYTWVWKH